MVQGMFDSWRGFKYEALTPEWRANLTEMARIARGHIITMTTVAASGHPGGSMSSLEVYLPLYHMAKVDPKNPKRDGKQREYDEDTGQAADQRPFPV